MPGMDLLDPYLQDLCKRPQEGAALVRSLMDELDGLRAQVGHEKWRLWVEGARSHGLHGALAKDPYTARALAKPRGYAGDAIMLDYVYGHPDVQSSVGEMDVLARSVHSYTAGLSPPARAVRWRRDWVATQIENLAAKLTHPRIFALACGHLREAEALHPSVYAAIGNWVAADQDEDSLVRLRHRHDGAAIQPRKMSVRDVLATGSTDPCFDLVYALGLYDYLDDRVAARLTGALWRLVSPGGRLILTNFAQGSRGAGYMEAFMDWWLIYRTDDELLKLSSEVRESEIAAVNSLTDPFAAVHYVEITRK